MERERYREDFTFENKELHGQEIVVKVGNKEIKINLTSKYFEYPQVISKEIGVLGYKRVVIENTDITALEAMIKHERKLGNITSRRPVSDIAQGKIIQLLSNGEYPNNCLTHIYGALSHRYDYSLRQKYEQQLVADKFFLQKIYGLDTIKAQQNQNSQIRVLDHRDDHGTLRTHFGLFERQSKKLVKSKLPINKLLDYEDQILSGDYFLASYDSGLNTMPQAFWSMGGGNFKFGFSKNDQLFKNYIEESLNLFSTIKTDVEDEYGDEPVYIERIIDFIEEDVKEYGESIDKYGYAHIARALRITNETEWGKLELDMGMIEKDSGYWCDDVSDTLEQRIPIFIGKEDIPQLSWAHAKYAHFMSEKGLNYIEFEHEERLP